MFPHRCFDAGVVFQALQEGKGFFGAREIGERAQGDEGIEGFFLFFFPVVGFVGFNGLPLGCWPRGKFLRCRCAFGY